MEKFVNVFSVASSHFFDDFRNFLTIYSSVRGLIILFIVTLIVFYYYRWKRFVNLIDKIPGPPVHPVAPWLGHAILVLDLDRRKFPYGTYVLIYQMLNCMNNIYKNERICRMWIGLRPIVVLFTAQEVEVILSSNTLIDKSVEYNFLKPWLGEGLVTSSRSKWKLRRKILTPAFHFRILEDFLPIINEQTTILMGKLRAVANYSDTNFEGIDIVPLITLCTLDVICETAMGIKVGCQANAESDYVQSLHTISSIFLIRLMRPWLWSDWMFNLSKHGRDFKDSLKKMQDFTMKVIHERRDEWIKHNSENKGATVEQLTSITNSEFFYGGKKRLAFLDLLLQQHLTANTLTLDDVREEVDTFMFAGHDTTAQAISWTLYMLGLHEDIQARVREEIDSIMENRPESDNINSDDAKEMKFLDCVLKEVQRLFPTAPFIGRELSEDTLINGYLVPKGTTCGIFTFVLHRDPDYYPKPEQFIPERFLPESMVGRHPFAYIPFSAGPRNCIGQKFAIMEQKIVVANVVRNFYLKAVDPRDKLVIVGEMVLRTRNGLKLFISERFANSESTNKNNINCQNHSSHSL